MAGTLIVEPSAAASWGPVEEQVGLRARSSEMWASQAAATLLSQTPTSIYWLVFFCPCFTLKLEKIMTGLHSDGNRSEKKII